MFDLKAYLEERSGLVDSALAARLPPESEPPARLHKAMRYAALAGGKRIRPILCLAAGECALQGRKAGRSVQCSVFSVQDATNMKTTRAGIITAALALEVLHTYTLVHDDLPCMDDDDLRRGKPTLHKAFGEAEAVLAGDALLTLAFEWLAEVQAPPPYSPNRLITELARASGSMGVIGGQFEDIGATGKASRRDSEEAVKQSSGAGGTAPSRSESGRRHSGLGGSGATPTATAEFFHSFSENEETAPCDSATPWHAVVLERRRLREKSSSAREALLRYIQAHKTGTLITASVRIGAIAAGVDEPGLAALTEYGTQLGAAFQAVDDILNATSTQEELGKAAGSDKAHDKLTCVSLYGLAKTKKLAAGYRDAAVAALSPLPSRNTKALAAIAEYVVSRSC